MKNGIIVSIITATIVYFYISKNTALNVLAVILTLIAIVYLFSKQAVIYNYYKSKFSNFEEGISSPFLNINKVSWKILMLVPNIDKMTAKHIVHNRRHFGNYKNIDDFFKINQIPEEARDEIKKYIII